MIPQGPQNAAVEQADKRPGTAASGAVETKVFVHHTGRHGNMWQEYDVKQSPCHNAHSQENASQIE